jgi:hypothetical protein
MMHESSAIGRNKELLTIYHLSIYLAHRCGQANNKYMKDYKSEKFSKYVTYFIDGINFYGNACIPAGGFRWISKTNRET